MSLPPLQLKKNTDRRLKRGHLWIYSNEVEVAKTPLKAFQAGDQVLVLASTGKALGVAAVNPTGLICARIINRDPAHPLDKSLLVHRINQAQALRDALFPGPYYRLIYGDSDLLPGLVVDRFGDYLIVQTASAGMERHKSDIIEALVQCLKPKGILLDNEHGARELEGLERYKEVVHGEMPDTLELMENDTRFRIPVGQGQKTGWFYDHRDNRARLQGWCKNKRVLDVFSYMGGWGVAAATAGAREVVCVDSSATALDGVATNAELNDVADRVSVIQGKAIDVLKALITDDETFDVVVLDPPAFIKRRKDQKAGEAAYRHINELAIRLLGRDGLLVSGSCSMHLTRDTLTDIVRGAGRHLDRHVQIVAQGGQSADHPIHPAIPETDYLKAVFARVYLP